MHLFRYCATPCTIVILSSVNLIHSARADDTQWRNVTITQNSKLNVAWSVLNENASIDGPRTSDVEIVQTGVSNWAYTIQSFTAPYVSSGDPTAHDNIQNEPVPAQPSRNSALDMTTASVYQRGQNNQASLYQNSPNNQAVIGQAARAGGFDAAAKSTQEDLAKLPDGRNYYSFESGEVDIKLMAPGVFAQSSSFGRNR